MGQPATFTVTLTNAGPDPANEVVVSDLLPAGLSLLAAIPSLGNYSPTSGTGRLGPCPPGLGVAARRSRPTRSARTPTSRSSRTPQPLDCNPGNESAQSTITVSAPPPPPVDLAIDKTVDNPRPDVGGTVTFTVTVSNPSATPDDHVVVSDPVPAGIAVDTTTPSQGTYDFHSGIWSVGTVAANSTATLTIVGHVAGCDPIVNTATIKDAVQPDPNPANNTSSVTVTPLNADLQLTKTVDNDHPNVGQAATFTVTLINAGPDPRTRRRLRPAPRRPDDPVGHSERRQHLRPTTGRWAVGDVPNGGSATLSITALAPQAGTFTNVATVSETGTFDCNPGNESAQSTITVGTPPPPTPVDLALDKTVDNPRPDVGGTVTFTVTVSNPSATPDDHVVVSDPVPAGIAVDTTTPSQGTYDFQSGIWSVGPWRPTPRRP